jgi:hypothetical protein
MFYFAIAQVLSSMCAMLWSVPFILLWVFKIRLYKLSNNNDVVKILNKLSKCSTITSDDGVPQGIIFDKRAVIVVQDTHSMDGPSMMLWVITSEKILRELLGNSCGKPPSESSTGDEVEETSVSEIALYERGGNFHWLTYSKRSLSVSRFVARDKQREIIDEVKAHYDEHGHTVVYLHGKPGTGKSLLGLLLTKEFSGSLCNTFDPTEPGDSLNGLYNRVSPEKETPLIVVLDEFDVILHNIHTGVAPHKNIPIQVKNKTTWNQFLDRIQIGMYPNLILVLTSNKTPDYINEMDPSYIRKGRVDLSCEV